MPETNPEDFECIKLDRMPYGTWKLGAPVEDGVVQVSAEAIRGFTGLIVVREADRITVERQDREPLQADFPTLEWIPGTIAFEAGRAAIFEEPVRRLTFEKSRMAGKTVLWRATGEGVKVANQEGVERLAFTVGDYVRQKWERIAREQRLLRIVERNSNRYG